MELLSKAVPITMLAFVVSSMLAVGLSLTFQQIVAPLRNGKLVFLALLANFVLMPLGALAIATLLRLDQPLGIALLLLGAAAGAPFLPKLAGIAKGNLAFAVGLMVLLMVLTVAYMPLVLPLLLEGVLALGTAQRNIAAALLVGGKDFEDPKVLVMIVVVAVVGLLILMPLARFLGTRGAETPA